MEVNSLLICLACRVEFLEGWDIFCLPCGDIVCRPCLECAALSNPPSVSGNSIRLIPCPVCEDHYQLNRDEKRIFLGLSVTESDTVASSVISGQTAPLASALETLGVHIDYLKDRARVLSEEENANVQLLKDLTFQSTRVAEWKLSIQESIAEQESLLDERRRQAQPLVCEVQKLRDEIHALKVQCEA
ncbi:hypothetical protein ONZ45_g8123 [Pleurotus djamor]|nr:hypothetical protein ONZ45_g8123 [Pleurotus djamor]